VRCAAIPKNKIKEAIGVLVKDYSVVAPAKRNGLLEFQKITDIGDDIIKAIDNDELPYKSPKEFLFPQLEKLMVFNNGCNLVEEEVEDKTVIIGVKPCDLEGLKVLTAVFSEGKYKDEKVIKRRENIILVGTGCRSKKPGCFCDERGVDKNFSKDCDIFIEKPDGYGKNYEFYSFTDTGDYVLDKFASKGLVADAVMDIPKSKPEAESQKAQLIIEADENTLFNKIDWGKIAEKCMGCGTCTYICPTCHCFDFKDVLEDGKAVRYRCWDSCMYPKFTLHASGHNPRPSKKERYRQRILHKYIYVKKNFGYIACTGCGRCIRSCPAGMNIKSVVHEIMGVLKSE